MKVMKLLTLLLVGSMLVAANVPRIKYIKVSGIKAAVIERPDVESVSIYMLVRGGSALDPKGKEGTAELVATLINKGTKKKKAMQIAEELERMGSELGAFAQMDYIYISAWSMKENLMKTAAIMGECITEATFPEEELIREKQRLITETMRKWDEPSYIASEKFREFVFAGHPYGREKTIQSIGNVEREDVVKFYRRYFVKNNIFLVFAGNVTTRQAKQILKKYFSHLPAGRPAPSLRSPAPTKATTIYIIDKPEQNQTQIRLGYVAVPRTYKDYTALRIMNYILGGGGFSSRLMESVRAKQGLTYGIHSYFSAYKYGGDFIVSTFTKNETVRKTLDVILSEIKRMKENGATAEELEAAKKYYIGHFPLSLETPSQIAQYVIEMELYGLPRTYLKNYEKNIEKVTLKKVNRMAARHLQTKNLVIVLVGPAEKLKPQVKDLGEVKIIKPKK